MWGCRWRSPFAIAGLLGREIDSAWARLARPWVLLAWCFLTAGIALGSWWAYYELGWGGWWFWDPVENASFIPWLVATALLHSLRVAEKRDTLKAWTLLLCITGFSLSLLGDLSRPLRRDHVSSHVRQRPCARPVHSGVPRWCHRRRICTVCGARSPDPA